jgi:hypothetical protein
LGFNKQENEVYLSEEEQLKKAMMQSLTELPKLSLDVVIKDDDQNLLKQLF